MADEVITPEAATPEVVAPVQATPEAQGTAPETPQFPTPVHEALAREGVDVSAYRDHSDLARDFINARQIAAHYQTNVAPYLNEFQQWRQSQAQAQPQPTAQQQAEWDAGKYFGEKWSGAKFDPKWNEYVQQGAIVRDPATNLFTVNPKFLGSVPQEAVDGLNRFSQWYPNAARDFFTGNPYQRTWEVLQEPLERWFQEKFGGTMQQYMNRVRDEVAEREFEKQHYNWLVQHNEVPGPDGKPVLVPVTAPTGQPQLSAYGQRFYQWRDYYLERGMPRAEAIENARARLEGEVALASLAKPQAQPAAAPAQPSFMANALNVASAPNGHYQPTPAGESPQSWGEMGSFFSDLARKAGVLAQ